jgi:hypothetical protein
MSLPEPSPEERAALAAERAKLGPNADERIRAVESYIEAQVGSDLARDINGRLVTAEQILGWERIISNGRAQQRSAAVAMAPSQQPSAPQEPNRVTEEQEPLMSQELSETLAELNHRLANVSAQERELANSWEQRKQALNKGV